MGRRAQHTAEELKELILEATRKRIEKGEGERPSAREIARDIKYAPGTIYNIFKNLDDVMLHVEVRLLRELDGRIAAAMEGAKGMDALRKFSGAYVEYAYSRPKLWRLIQEHHPISSKSAPDWYLECLYAPVSRLESVVGKLIASRDADEIARGSRLIWAATTGVVNVATTVKFGVLPINTTIMMVDDLIDSCIASARAGAERPDVGRRVEIAKRA